MRSTLTMLGIIIGVAAVIAMMEIGGGSTRSIENAIDEIGGELHSQYTLSYMPTDGDAAGYHEIKVSLLRNDAKSLKIRARPGYYLAPPEG